MDNEYGKFENIVMDFNGFKALNGISLKIQDGEFYRGPWGRPVAAKPRCYGCWPASPPPSSGEIRIGEQVVANRDYVLPPQ